MRSQMMSSSPFRLRVINVLVAQAARVTLANVERGSIAGSSTHDMRRTHRDDSDLAVQLASFPQQESELTDPPLHRSDRLSRWSNETPKERVGKSHHVGYAAC